MSEIKSNEDKGAKIIKIVVICVVSIAIAAAGFLAGFFTSRLTRPKSSSSYEWAIKTILENYYDDVSEQELLNSSLEGISAQVLDIYSDYYTAEEYRAVESSNAGNKSGVGISYSFLPEGVYDAGSGVYIERVVGNSPAERSGLKEGTFVLGARSGGESVTFNKSSDFTEFMNARAEGETFTFVTDRGEYELSRQEYVASYCSMATSTTTYSFTYEGGKTLLNEKEGGIAYLPQGAAYIRLDQFYGNAVSEFVSLMEQFNAQNCTSLVLDLRGNGGGYVDVMCGISGIFTGQLQNASRIACSAIYKNGKTENFSVKNAAPASSQLKAGTKVSVLADSGTASASEALIGVLVSAGVVGYGDIYLSDLSEGYLSFTGTAAKNCRTYGKGIMQSTFRNYLTGEALKLTVAKIYWPNGKCIHGVGLTQEDGCKTVKGEWDVTYGDEQLAAAVAAIYA